MPRLQKHGRFLIFNGTAALIFIVVLTQGTDTNVGETFNSELESGKWAVRFLLICLAMTPLRIVFGWSGAIKLRKSAGLWSFAFAVAHLFFYWQSVEGQFWVSLTQPFILWGLTGFAILTVLALTSNRWAMRRLKKNWKRVHRFVYLAAVIVIVHAVLAAQSSKKVLLFDPDAQIELAIYFLLLMLLLLIRVPWVQRQLVRKRRRARIA